MNKFIRNTGIVMVAFLLVMTTGGFSIYHHICKCSEEQTSSFFFQTSCTHEKEADLTPGCCKVEVPDCCSAKSPARHGKSHKTHNCCNTSSIFIKIADSFHVATSKPILKFLASFIQVLNPVDLFLEPVEHATSVKDLIDKSPPLFGTELLVHLHQLKIAHPLV